MPWSLSLNSKANKGDPSMKKHGLWQLKDEENLMIKVLLYKSATSALPGRTGNRSCFIFQARPKKISRQVFNLITLL